MWWLGGLLSAQAGTPECEHFGEVLPAEAMLDFGGPSATFEIEDGDACGGDDCTWRVDGDLGTLSAVTGSSIEYTPPPVPQGCIDTALQLRAKCPGTAGSSVLTLLCPRPPADSDGGGCGSGSLVLLPLALLRRESAVRGHRNLAAHR